MDDSYWYFGDPAKALAIKRGSGCPKCAFNIDRQCLKMVIDYPHNDAKCPEYKRKRRRK